MLGPLPGLSIGAAAGGSSPCTVGGGQARLLFFPPSGNSGASGGAEQPAATITSAPAAGGQPVPAGGAPLTAWSNTFNPNYCYMSVNTMYATVPASGTESARTVGPIFSNAIIPFHSSDISTQCSYTMSGANAAPTQVDFNGLGSANCHHIVAPGAMASIAPEWSNGAFWNMQFQPPQQLLPQGQTAATGAASGAQCPAYTPATGQPYPTMVTASGYTGVASGPTTAPAGVTPSTFGQYTASSSYAAGTTAPAAIGGVPASSSGYTAGYGPNGTSAAVGSTGAPTQPAQYQGGTMSNLNVAGGSSWLVVGLLLSLLVL